MHRTTPVLSVALLLSAPCLADELHVPADHPTIQEAINAASDGDEVIVAPGTYAEALDMRGKAITVRSSGGPDVTTLDGSEIGTSIVLCDSGETLETVLEGFTLADGTGADRNTCVTSTGAGGAIYITFSALTVRDCVFVRNGFDIGLPAGGAIAAYNASLTIEGSSFIENGGYNDDPDDGVAFGGAVYMCNGPVEGDLVVIDSVFSTNGPASHGGGIWVTTDGDVSVVGTTFEGNEASHGGGISVFSYTSVYVGDCVFRENTASFGGGLNISISNNEYGDPAVGVVERCEFESNTGGFAGGLFAMASMDTGYPLVDPEIHVTDCSFTGNEAFGCCNTGIYWTECFRDGSTNGRFFGGAGDLRVLYGGLIEITNCLVTGNDATLGGGFHLATCGGGDIRVINGTFADNGSSGLHLRLGEASSYQSRSSLDVHNTISWGNGVSAPDNLVVESDGGPDISHAVTYSNIEGGAAGAGNIDADPLFASGYGLEAGSPSIDAADNTQVPIGLLTDLAGNPRFFDDPDTADTGVSGGAGGNDIVDMGALEFQGFDCRVDLTGDGVVDTRDFVAFLNAWSANEDLADWNGDGVIDTRDFVRFLGDWAAGC